MAMRYILFTIVIIVLYFQVQDWNDPYNLDTKFTHNRI